MRLPFFYGWIIIAVTFVTMAIGVNARTAFSLLFPPILGEFGWDRGVTAGAFSFGFVVSAASSPLIGRLMDRLSRRRGLAIGLAFAGVGIGSMTLLPWVQLMIEQTGWRTACTAMGLLVLIALAPVNLLLRKRPEDIGLRPDGDEAPSASSAKPVSNIVDPEWAGIDWTLKRALATSRFWWLAIGYFGGLYVWYAVQVHQTKYLLDIGFSPNVAV